ncbi:NAD(P)/FAD-dependent oxidoreductase [Alkalimarinus sediminis]|uniref:FAD-dependent oxidoreductase n=1 Tax=Alkalimarinus sediminis TaxID=1632866 RepID=A0A9E8HP95_9ALTE|nr:FAD-dependent oxidoreductase [Alkalimarinus sediminis]UZW73976.1 FAD-dependent oxidoreductase [Alkalimarinus sediminis]
MTETNADPISDGAPIVIIGTGLSGYSLAREVRKLNKDVPLLLVTADDGHSYSKPMLSTGFTKAKTAEQLSMADPGKMAEQLSIDVRTYTTVTRIDTDQHIVRIGDEALKYSKLVIAWGADVVRLDIPGSGVGSVFSINDLADYRLFREALNGKKRVLIMGAGLIGCEFANDLRVGGYDVDVVAPSETALTSLLPLEAGESVAEGLTNAGVRFHFGRVVTQVDKSEGGVSALLDDGSTIETDIVISAVGLKPRTVLAKNAGLEVNSGIVVNRMLETSAPDVFALGDCAEVDGQVMLYVLPLMACARALAKTLVGQPTSVKYGVMPIMTKTPACPAVVLPPRPDVKGAWTIEREAGHVKALFNDLEGGLHGFALTGDFTPEKQALAKLIPAED